MEKNNSSLNDVKMKSLISTFASLCSTFIVYPFDVIKMRRQVDVGFSKISIYESITKIVKQEGVKALYRGSTIPVLFDGLFYSMLFTNVNILKYYLEHNYHYSGIKNSLIAGTVAGLIQAPLANVFELVKIRIQNIRSKYTGTNYYQVFREIFVREGIYRVAKRGLLATMVRDSIPLGLMVASVDHMPKVLERLQTGEFSANLLSSMVALVAAWTFYPADLLKSNIQAVRKDKYTWKEGARMCKAIWLERGLAGFYDGYCTTILRGMPQYIIMIMIMHYSQKALAGIRTPATTTQPDYNVDHLFSLIPNDQ